MAFVNEAATSLPELPECYAPGQDASSGNAEAKELLELEKQVLSTLQFDIQIETSLNFVDRFLTLYCLDCKSARTFDQ